MKTLDRMKANQRTGMTLVEVLVGLVIVSILLAGLLSFFARGQQDFFKGNVRSDVLDKARYPLSWIGRDVNVARAVTQVHEGMQVSTSVLLLRLPTLDANGYVTTDNNQYDDVVYYVSNHRLIRHCHTWPNSYRPGGDRTLADNVAGLVLTYYDADGNVLSNQFSTAVAIRAEVTVSTDVGSRNFRQPLSTRFTLRNKSQ